jgi:histidyl-tRNA synthetase
MSINIQPTPISGFPEFLPEEQILFNELLDIIRSGYARNGFVPIETPAVERKEVLTSKGGNEREIYALNRLVAEDGSDETDLALHFDLTVPLARYVAMHSDKLSFPFRRYQIQKVWRGERAQAGRYREFYQCDIDVIGRGTLSLWTDAEIPSVIYQIFKQMNIGDFVIRLSNRKILFGYLTTKGLSESAIPNVMRIVDKLEKIGRSHVLTELENNAGLTSGVAEDIIAFLEIRGTNDDIMYQVNAMKADMNETFVQGVEELATVIDGIRGFNVPEPYFQIDLSIVRGLDYYTGTVYETMLVDYPSIGSICSGGRYENLASYFTNELLPGVGISIGLTRLAVRLIDANILRVGAATTAPVIVTTLQEEYMTDYLRIAAELRNAGIGTEVYLEADKLGKQMRYANKKGFKFAIISGDDEFTRGKVKIKDMASGEEFEEESTLLVSRLLDLLS